MISQDPTIGNGQRSTMIITIPIDDIVGIVDMSTTTFTHPPLELELNDK
jgi:hypothetical protein